MSSPEEPEKLTETEAKGGSKTKANATVMIVSIVAVVVIFVGLLIAFR